MEHHCRTKQVRYGALVFVHFVVACHTKEATPIVEASVIDAATPAAADAAADVADAGRCTDWNSSTMRWFVVKDRKVDRSVDPPVTTVMPGVTLTLLVASRVVKSRSHFWMPIEKVKFASCAPVIDRSDLPADTMSAIRCDGHYFIAVPVDGYVGAKEALVPPRGKTPVWTNVPRGKEGDPKWLAECATVDEAELSPEVYMRDLVGPKTFP